MAPPPPLQKQTIIIVMLNKCLSTCVIWLKFAADWLDLIGFGWIWLGLIGSDWVWLDLIGFDWIWLGVIRGFRVNWSCPVSVCSNFHIRIWDPAEILQRTDVSPWPCFPIQPVSTLLLDLYLNHLLDLYLYLRPTSTQCLSFLPPVESLPLLTQSGLDSLQHRCPLPVYRLDNSGDVCCYCMKLFTSII